MAHDFLREKVIARTIVIIMFTNNLWLNLYFLSECHNEHCHHKNWCDQLVCHHFFFTFFGLTAIYFSYLVDAAAAAADIDGKTNNTLNQFRLNFINQLIKNRMQRNLLYDIVFQSPHHTICESVHWRWGKRLNRSLPFSFSLPQVSCVSAVNFTLFLGKHILDGVVGLFLVVGQ